MQNSSSNAPPRDEEVGVLPVITLVLWVGCSIVGWIGTRAIVPVRLIPTSPASAPAVPITVLDVQLADDPTPPDQDLPAAGDAEQGANDPDPTVPLPAPPSAPAAAVAAPSPLIEFAQPIEGAVHIVSASLAAPTRPMQQNPDASNTIVAAPPPIKRLTFGQGEGRQVKPEYPDEARLTHQQGTVVIHMTVAEDGSVISAQIAQPSPFPLLNEAALRAVRDQWRFSSGPPRAYEVAIVFSLKQR